MIKLELDNKERAILNGDVFFFPFLVFYIFSSLLQAAIKQGMVELLLQRKQKYSILIVHNICQESQIM